MTLKDIQAILDGELLTLDSDLALDCSTIFASDLMSDVLAFMDAGSILMTGLVNSHVVRTACLAEARAIIIVQGKRPDPTVVNEAGRHKIPILATSCPMFEACARIARSGLASRR